MRKTIHWNSCKDPNRKGENVVGIEIQPPVSNADLDGIITELLPTETEASGPKPYTSIAESASRTRNDEAGSALVVTPNYLHASAAVPLAIGRLLDPCGVHDIAYEPPMPEGTTLETMRAPHIS
ncbi:MAG TPA: hypothetical protein VHT70_01070 [Candidatus Saccharimonadales bacterium]|jgi:hypothetical protein|nr:hypothetical protein [Candidatus Saccharimonadales bacterium]